MATKQSRRDCHGLRPRNDDFYMKLIYSQLKNWLPDLTVSPKQLRDDLTLIGHFASGYEEIGNETVLDLEIRQNRADCLGYYGIARDLAVFYNLKINLPSSDIVYQSSDIKLPINVDSSDVHRLQATRLSNIKNTSSPDWLKNFLALHDINSINTLVDLTNYIMIWWGIPCHAFDTAKVSSLTWENNHKKDNTFTTLDGTILNLTDYCLLITDNEKPVSLSFIGGQNSGIELSTTETIIEMAVYNRSRVRSDSRGLKTITEASIRLDKELDTESIPLAFNHLISLIQEHSHGEISSELLDIYPLKPTLPQITFDPTKPAQYAGIEIPSEESVNILKKLGCAVDNNTIVPPSIRKDIILEEDLIEEVVRFHGYNKIPLDQPISSDPLPDVTPKILYLIEKIKDDLVVQGYDEVRSWPLVSSPLNKTTAIYTQNSINSEYPVLRQSIIQSLKVQLENYQRYKVPSPKFFEIGKIYYQEQGKYIERYALGMYSQDADSLRRDVARYVSTDVKITDNYAEVILEDLPKPDIYIPKNISNTAIELTSQIITLDANVSLTSPQDPLKLIKEYSSKIDKNILWSMQITDVYHDEKLAKYRYTFRVNYYNCDDKTAKKIHLSAFNLTNEKYNYIDPKSPTVLAYYDDMYQTEIDAEVINIKNINGNTYLILDKTLFFPEGGGQPSDTGTINNIGIQELKYKDEQVLHQVNANVFKVGDKVNQKIDWSHRYKYMKIHSAGHLLHEALTQLYPQIKPLKGWHQDEAYLIYDGQINSSDLENIEKEVNKLVEENLPILCDYTDLETLSKDATSVPKNLPLHKKLRRLKIGNFPSMADGGVQVKTTKEIGKIKITKIIFKNNQTKIDYVVE